jgi:hypothetical protein
LLLPCEAADNVLTDDEDNVLTDAEAYELFGGSDDYQVLDDTNRDLFAVACADWEFVGRYAHDPDNDPPVDTFWGRWARGERELELVDACEQRIAALQAVQCRALVRFAGLRPDQNGRGTGKYVAEEIGVGGEVDRPVGGVAAGVGVDRPAAGHVGGVGAWGCGSAAGAGR